MPRTWLPGRSPISYRASAYADLVVAVGLLDIERNHPGDPLPGEATEPLIGAHAQLTRAEYDALVEERGFSRVSNAITSRVSHRQSERRSALWAKREADAAAILAHYT